MRNYTFRFIEGSSGPHKTLSAEDENEFYAKLRGFLAEKPGRTLVAGTIRFSESGWVADPPQSHA